MRNPGGYAFTFDPGGIRQEADTFTCNHCNKVVVVKPRCDPAELGGMCRLCVKMICPDCVNHGVCVPFEKKIEQEEKEYRRRRAQI